MLSCWQETDFGGISSFDPNWQARVQSSLALYAEFLLIVL
jgi:hypothetical protein